MLWYRNGIVLLVCVWLSACGFQPLHAPLQTGDTPLTSVAVSPIPDRAGHVLRVEIEQRLYRGQVAASSQAYQLDVTYNETIAFSGIDADASARYATLTAEVLYKLTDTQTKTVILRDIVVVNQGYSIVASEYASLKAQEDARLKAIRQVADTLAFHIAVRLQK
jgi:LPS-assembly lipoprotein